MFIPLNPLFKLSHALLRTEGGDFPGKLWAVKNNDRVIPFSRGQWALKELGTCIINSRGRTRGMIFIPEYFCEISLTPLRSPYFDILFYRITPQLEPDITHLNRIIEKYGVPDILLFVHYFGFPSDMRNTETWCRENNVVIIEDAAHSLLSVSGIGDHGYPTIFTPWKFLNIPCGALLVLPEESEFFLKVCHENHGFLSYPLGWMTKQVIYTAVQKMRFPLHKFKKRRVKGYDESEPPVDPGRPECTPLSSTILSKEGIGIAAIGEVRERNYRRIDGAIADSGVRHRRFFHRLPTHFAPYVYPLRINGSTSVETMLALNRIGIPAQPWSDLSPEVKGSAEYPLSNALRKEVMVLPVHQDLSLRQIDWMTREVIRTVSKN